MVCGPTRKIDAQAILWYIATKYFLSRVNIQYVMNFLVGFHNAKVLLTIFIDDRAHI